MSVTMTGADSGTQLWGVNEDSANYANYGKSGRRLSSPAGGLYRGDVYWRQGASLVKKSAKEPQHRAFCLASETEGVLRKDRTGINNLSHHIRRIVHQAILSFPSLCKFVWFWDYLVLPYSTLGNRGEGGGGVPPPFMKIKKLTFCLKCQHLVVVIFSYVLKCRIEPLTFDTLNCGTCISIIPSIYFTIWNSYLKW